MFVCNLLYTVSQKKHHPFYVCDNLVRNHPILQRIIIGSDRRPETKQGIEGKIVRFRSWRVRDKVGVRDKDRRSEPDRRSESDCQSEAINFGTC